LKRGKKLKLIRAQVNTSLESKLPYLKDRAQLFQKARAFFETRGVMEVDCPLLSPSAPVDEHIDILKVHSSYKQNGYLHSSTEYAMKRLLASGSGDIYQISHVFRDGEVGPLHNPEFTMVEWYRKGISFDAMIAETSEFIQLFLGPLPQEKLSYRQTFKHFLNLDYLSADVSDLIACAKEHHLDIPADATSWSRDTLLQLLLSFLIEPKLGTEDLFILTHFPQSQAALAKITTLSDNEPVGCRFEIYHQGIELCNGYHELTCATEQKRRFEGANCARCAAGKEALKIDEKFLQALEAGLPDCCGVAVGFDRLMMLRHKHKSLRQVVPMTWEEA